MLLWWRFNMSVFNMCPDLSPRCPVIGIKKATEWLQQCRVFSCWMC